MIRWLCVAALLAGCGARTGAEVDPAAEREPAPFDAGFDTFPCRWSLAQPTVLHRARVHFEVGAIHATRDEALIVWSSGDGFAGARLMLADPPPVLDRFGPEIVPDSTLAPPHGVRLADPSIAWVRGGGSGEGCGLLAMRDAPPWFELLEMGPGTSCILERHDPDRVDLTVRLPGEVLLWSAHDVDSPTVRRVPVAATTAFARSVRVDEATWMLFTIDADGTVTVHRVTSTGVEQTVVSTEATASLQIAPDRVRGGAVMLLDVLGRIRLERFPSDGELRGIPLVDFDRMPIRPAGRMTTNETEALFPLFDGRVAVVPLDGSAIRFIDPGPPVDAVVLRPGSSGGGLLYEREERELVFQPLTCNR